jgi:hypothetical protein
VGQRRKEFKEEISRKHKEISLKIKLKIKKEIAIKRKDLKVNIKAIHLYVNI